MGKEEFVKEITNIEEDFDKYIATLGYNYERNNRTVF